MDEHITTADTDNQKAEAGDEANPHPAPMHKITRQESRVMPKYEDELRELFAQQVSSQRREEEAFEKLEARQSILAQEQLANENADSFGWMQTFHCSESKSLILTPPAQLSCMTLPKVSPEHKTDLPFVWRDEDGGRWSWRKGP